MTTPTKILILSLASILLHAQTSAIRAGNPDTKTSTTPDQLALLKSKIASLEARVIYQAGEATRCQQLYASLLQIQASPLTSAANTKEQEFQSLITSESKKCKSGKLNLTDFTCLPLPVTLSKDSPGESKEKRNEKK